MTLVAGARLGPYEILSPLGAGGMGEVWRARDTRLGREVAIKVLPDEVARDAERLRRFEQEARAASALNHPNILVLFDVGTDGRTPYLVTELLEGETLRALLDGQRRVPLRKALDWGAQIARGLAAAHERGIVHRDLKPANVLVTRDGRLKILDFGLAKLRQAGAVSEDEETRTRQALTEPGLAVGTVGYMAPEQVRGHAADPRSDLFALGCILYELLTGRRAFERGSRADTMSAILRDDPPEIGADASGRGVGPAVERIVRRCLEKSPDERFQSARDLAFDLEAAAETQGAASAVGGALAGGPARRLSLAALGVVALLAFLAGAALGRLLLRPAPEEPPTVRYLTYSGSDRQPAVSPDGRTVAFVSTRDGRQRIWLKQLATGDEAPLTEGADYFPRFSPDGGSLLFARSQAEGFSLYRVSLLGGEPRRLARAAREGDWSPGGEWIVFVRDHREPSAQASELWIARADGGEERRLIAAERRILGSPRWSPDGETVAAFEFNPSNVGAPGAVVAIDVADGARRVLGATPRGLFGTLAWSRNGWELLYALPESVSFVASPSTRIVRLDVASGRTRGALSLPALISDLEVGGPGRLVVTAESSRQNLRETPLSPGGEEGGARWLTRGQSNDRQPVYSPDGRRIAFSSDRGGNLDLWAVERESGALRRLTDDPADDWDPAFTPDGRHLLWSSNRSGNFEIWIAEADGGGARQVTRDGVDAENPTATADGWIVYSSSNPQGPGVWKIRADGSQATRLVAGSLVVPEASPDGRHAVFVTQAPLDSESVRATRIDEGSELPFKIALRRQTPILGYVSGRSRWLPDGRGIVFAEIDETGLPALYETAFAPGGAATAPPRRVAGSEPGAILETFGVSPDGTRLAVGVREDSAALIVVDGLAGVDRPRRD